MNLENSNYVPGKRAYSEFLIFIAKPLYRKIKLRKHNISEVVVDGFIPKTGGLIIAAHHEDDADPVVLMTAINRRLNWIASSKFKGESVLDHKAIKKLIDWFGIITIDAKNKERNAGLFDYLEYLTSIGESVVIFPEGNLKKERNNQKFGVAKDGVIRLANHIYEKTGFEVPIYPVGINYINVDSITGRRIAKIKIGKPFYIAKSDSTADIENLMSDIRELSS